MSQGKVSRFTRRRLIQTIAAAPMISALPSFAQDPVHLKMSTFTAATGRVGQAIAKWGELIGQQTDGLVTIDNFYGGAMGPMAEQYNMVRKGVADICYHQTTSTPGQFPLTELIAAPYMVPDGAKGALVGTSVLNSMLDKLEDEYEGVKVIFLTSSRPSVIYDVNKPITTLGDLQGRRYRVGSAWIRDIFKQIGGTPVGMPPTEMAEALQKGIVDGVITDAGAVQTFKVGNLLHYRTPAFFVPFTFVFGMNMDAYKRLPDKARDVIDKNSGLETAQWVAKYTWGQDLELEQYMEENPQQDSLLTADAEAGLREVSEAVIAQNLSAYEAKGLPAKAIYDEMKTLSAKFSTEL